MVVRVTPDRATCDHIVEQALGEVRRVVERGHRPGGLARVADPVAHGHVAVVPGDDHELERGEQLGVPGRQLVEPYVRVEARRFVQHVRQWSREVGARGQHEPETLVVDDRAR
jgi:hypothetical protein